jgi:hypothetical protein
MNGLPFARYKAWCETAFTIPLVLAAGLSVEVDAEHGMKAYPPLAPVIVCVFAAVAVVDTVCSWQDYRRLRGAQKVTAPAQCLTRIAVLLAGSKRAALGTEWAAHLIGETGTALSRRRQARDALGFVASAARCRLADVSDAAWTPVDAILKSRKLSNLLVFGPTAMAAIFIFRHGGALGVVTSAEGISAIGGGLYALVRVGRWWRDVRPPEPKARRVGEQ